MAISIQNGITLSKGEFAWRKGDKHSTVSRLDKLMVFDDWDTRFRNIKQSTLERIGSTKSNFKFENWWPTTEGFNDRGRPNFELVAKLRELKGTLKEWSKTNQEYLKQQKQLVPNQLAEL
ncbi:hypothetical protein H5410_046781 [Solanum commersonii]|uniref:Uncharacterized protein n=1 Tax=Solanum commersonii TaxID=4109 RepID=A0A9J5XD85_SOLCO|nr:hypothetical protein H5410_046781 [Solanum commersonii]